MHVKLGPPAPQPGATPAHTPERSPAISSQPSPIARRQPVPPVTTMCPLRPDGVDSSVLIGVAGVLGLAVPVAGEIEIGVVLGALGQAALARGLAAAPALPGAAKLIGDGLARNPNGPTATLHWAKHALQTQSNLNAVRPQ